MAHPLPILSLLDTRVLGTLVEKQHTVPDSYPLSVQASLDTLKSGNLVVETSGSRVARYAHNVERVLQVPSQSVALLTLLMLRGPQTAGELRIAAERLHRFADISAVEAFLAELAARPAGALVVQLPRLPGARENRWAHTLSGAPRLEAKAPAAPGGDSRLAQLEAEVAELKQAVSRIRAQLGITD